MTGQRPMKETIARMRLLAMHAFVHEHLGPQARVNRRITDTNRIHRERAPDGSQAAMDRINAAALKRLARQRRAAKSQASGSVEPK